MGRISQRARWAASAFAIYAGAIIASNWLIGHIGIPTFPGGPHLTAVGFGLMAPSGVWAAALSFPARDVVQRIAGGWLGVAAILAGAGISYLVSDPRIALASGLTYLVSETVDFGIYTSLQPRRHMFSARWFTSAVVVSALAAGFVDSWLFLHAANWLGAPLNAGFLAVLGLFVGKAWVAAVAGPAAWGLRKAQPVAVPA